MKSQVIYRVRSILTSLVLLWKASTTPGAIVTQLKSKSDRHRSRSRDLARQLINPGLWATWLESHKLNFTTGSNSPNNCKTKNLSTPTSFKAATFAHIMESALGKKEVRLPQLPSSAACQSFENKNISNRAEIEANGDKSRDIDPELSDFDNVVSTCAESLSSGGVIAVPTDTIYGVACLAQKTKAVNQLYEIKQRNVKNPVAISVASIDDIYRWSTVTVSRQVLEDLLPGPVTVVFERSPELNPALNPHTNLIGLRIPGHKFMQDLAKKCEGPIALTSANISGATSCLRIEEFDVLWPHLDLVVNGGTLIDSNESRLGSTVIDLSVPGTFRIIRPGSAHESTVSCLKGKHMLREVPS